MTLVLMWGLMVRSKGGKAPAADEAVAVCNYSGARFCLEVLRDTREWSTWDLRPDVFMASSGFHEPGSSLAALPTGPRRILHLTARPSQVAAETRGGAATPG